MTNSQRTQPKANDLRGILLRIYPFGAWVTSCHRPFCQRVVGQWFVLCSIVCFCALHPAVSRIERHFKLVYSGQIMWAQTASCLTNVTASFLVCVTQFNAFPVLVPRSSNQDRSCTFAAPLESRLENHCQDSHKSQKKHALDLLYFKPNDIVFFM